MQDFKMVAHDLLAWLSGAGDVEGVDTLQLWAEPAETARSFLAALQCFLDYPGPGDAAEVLTLEHVAGSAAVHAPGVILNELSFTMARKWFDSHAAPFSRPTHDIHGNKLVGPLKATREGISAVRAADADDVTDRIPETSWPASDGSIQGLLTTKPLPRKWFALNRLIAGRAHLLTGIGGSFKTTVEYLLAIAGVIGRLPWNWQVEQTGTSLLFLTEDVEEDVHETIWTMVDAMQLTAAERDLLGVKLRIWPLAGQDARLLSLNGQAIYENGRGLGLIEKCKQFDDVVFIGLDPALGLTEGEEMSQAHQRYLGQYADRLAIETGACVVLVSHATKASAQADELTSHQSRGGGAITDAMRGEFVMRVMTTKEAKGYGVTDMAERKRHVQLVATKGNKLPPEAYVPTWLRRGIGGTLSAAELPEIDVSGLPKASYNDFKVLDVLKEMHAVTTPTLSEWRDECVRRQLLTGRTPEAMKKSMDRIRDRLHVGRLIEHGATRGIYVPVDDEEA
jgi:hypothetical protein